MGEIFTVRRRLTTQGVLALIAAFGAAHINIVSPDSTGASEVHASKNGRSAQTQVDLATLEQMATSQPMELLILAISEYDRNIHDYTGTLIKRERIDGKLGDKQEINVQFMESPFSVLMMWDRDKGRIDRALFVDGEHENQMLVRPTGLAALMVKKVKLSLDDPNIVKGSRRAIDKFGLCYALKELLAGYEMSQQNGHSGHQFLGISEFDGRPTLVIKRTVPYMPEYPCSTVIVQIDARYLVPVRIEQYGWTDELLAYYEFYNLQFNTGLSEADFQPAMCGM